MILVIDSSSTTASVAIGNKDKIYFSAQLNSGNTHSEQLLPLIVQALNHLKLSVKDLDAVGVTIGPGSFTGLRIGMATAKGLAQGAKRPFLAIPTLDVLAENGRGYEGLVCPILNARRGEVYTALYQNDEGRLTRLTPYQAIALEHIMDEMPVDEKVFYTGDGLDAYEAIIRQRAKHSLQIAWGTHRYVTGDGLIRVALERLEKQGPDDLYQTLPMYIRQSEAVIKWEEAHPGENIED